MKRQPSKVIKVRKVVDFSMVFSLLSLFSSFGKECAGEREEGRTLEKSVA